jgi:hypothetical protein
LLCGASATRSAAFASKRHFANVWQKRAEFAKHWQNVSRARRMDLPMFGNFPAILPNIGKSGKTRGVCRASPGFAFA